MYFVFPNLSVNIPTISIDNTFYLHLWTMSKETFIFVFVVTVDMYGCYILFGFLKKKKKKKLLQSSIFMENRIFRSA